MLPETIKIVNRKSSLSSKSLLIIVLFFLSTKIAMADGWEMPSTPPSGAPEDFNATVLRLTNWALGFISLVAVLGIIWGGVIYLVSVGEEDKMQTGKKAIQYSIMGLVVAGISYAIVNVIVTVILTP